MAVKRLGRGAFIGPVRGYSLPASPSHPARGAFRPDLRNLTERRGLRPSRGGAYEQNTTPPPPEAGCRLLEAAIWQPSPPEVDAPERVHVLRNSEMPPGATVGGAVERLGRA